MTAGASYDLTDRALLEIMQNDLPLIPRPYEVVAGQLGVDEDEILRRLTHLLDEGIVRSITPILEPGRVGNRASTLVAVHIPDDRIPEIVPVINGYPEISHNFQRENYYSVWFTISAPDRNRIESILTDIKRRTGIEDSDFIELPTLRKFKADVRFQLADKDR